MSNRLRKSAKTIGTDLPSSALFAVTQDADRMIGAVHRQGSAHPLRGIGVPHPESTHSEDEPVTPGAYVHKPVEKKPAGDRSLEEEDLARLALRARKVRKQRLSRARLGRVLGELEADEDEGKELLGHEDEDDVQLVRLLIASRVLRNRKAKRLLLAHLLRERIESEAEQEEGDDSGEEDGDRELVRLIAGSRILRRKRVRRMLLAHLLRERDEEAV